MNKRQFLLKLDRALMGLTDDERRRQVDYFEELINDMLDEGMTEEDAVARLGSVSEIAARILAEAPQEQRKKHKKIGPWGIVGIVFVALELITLLLCVLFAVDHTDASIDPVLNMTMRTPDGWIESVQGEKLLFDPKELAAQGVNSLDIDWPFGPVIVGDNGLNDQIVFSVSAADAPALCHGFKDNVLYVSAEEEVGSETFGLVVMIPEKCAGISGLTASTGFGNITVNSEAFSHISAVTTSGEIDIEDCEAAQYDLVTASGAVTVEADDECRSLNVTTASGNITVLTDEDESFRMDYASCTGTVNVDFDKNFKNESGMTESGEGIPTSYFHGRDSKDRMFLLVTVSGNIRVAEY